MKIKSYILLYVPVFLFFIGLPFSFKVTAQEVRKGSVVQKFKMTTEIPQSITTPDSVSTSIGTLRFFDGFPDSATASKVYDNLDFQRGVQSYLTALPAAASYAMREGYLSFGPANQTLLISESMLDSRSMFSMNNAEVIYNLAWFDIKDGPLVIEIPPNVLGYINDFWSRYVGDVGRTGKDHGEGGKYLLLPPGYAGEVPDGYHVLSSRTHGNSILFRGFVVNNDRRPAIENTKKYFKVYPLDLASNPPAINFVNISGKTFHNLPASDFTFFEQVFAVVQEEPLEAVDPETRGLLASIGIQKNKPFAPDARMKDILADATAVGNATARTITFSTRDSEAFYYPDQTWKMGWVGNDPEFQPGGVLNLDARTLYFYATQGVSPAMAVKMVGVGSQYATTEHDITGEYLDGAKNYSLRLPPNIPVKEFWSLTVYDPQTRSMLQTDQQYPEVSSQNKDITINPDTSVDVYFGPKPPPGKEANWIQTIPGKGWLVTLRLYGPLDAWFDKAWRPGEIEPVK